MLLVIDSLGSGGAQRQMVWLAKGLAERGHRVSLFNYYPHLDHFRASLSATAVELIDYRKSSRFSVAPAYALRREIRARHPDIALAFLNTPGIYTLLAACGTRTRTVVSERWMFAGDRLPLTVRARYQLYRLADGVTVNSEHQRQRIARKFPRLSSRLSVIWNGVDLHEYAPREATSTAPSTATRLLAAATIVPWKNAYNLIQALALARQQGHDIEIDWAGKQATTAAGQHEYRRCEVALRELDLQRQWRWLGERGDMAELYPRYDALVHPSFLEGLPNVVCEALAAGLPVLASTIGDHPLLVSEDVNGYLFEPDDPTSIGAALSRFAQLPPQRRREFGRASRAFATERLSVDRLVDNYERLLVALRH